MHHGVLQMSHYVSYEPVTVVPFLVTVYRGFVVRLLPGRFVLGVGFSRWEVCGQTLRAMRSGLLGRSTYHGLVA